MEPLDILLSNVSDKPIYQQIVDQVRQQILRGDLAEGDLLPSIRLLAKELRISVITTKRAYDELERDGFLISTVGKGSFVAPKNLELLREMHLRQLEDKLVEAIDLARQTTVSRPQLHDLIDLLYVNQQQGDES